MKIDIEGITQSDDVDTGDLCIDEFTDNVTIPGTVKYAIYEGLGGSLGVYFGFAPNQHARGAQRRIKL
ncbi:MAG: hypothetical protein HOC71_14620 [Candidatus Latescibacteria bacterium]|jgi:hypothetical protein|nr:hypothetical protein [Candidatus Latescibacterota bacterium]